jgi:hypothetical protein
MPLRHPPLDFGAGLTRPIFAAYVDQARSVVVIALMGFAGFVRRHSIRARQQFRFVQLGRAAARRWLALAGKSSNTATRLGHGSTASRYNPDWIKTLIFSQHRQHLARIISRMLQSSKA